MQDVQFFEDIEHVKHVP